MPEVSVAVLAGDGIGPEVVAEARRVVDAIAPDHGLAIDWHDHLVGGISIDAHGTALTDEVLEACRAADAVLLGAVGGPRWDTTDPDRPRPEQGLLGLRSGLGLYANLRPVRPWPALYDASPLRRERIEGTDLLVVRELTGGLYFGERGREADRAFDTCVYTRGGGGAAGRVGLPGGRRPAGEGDLGGQGQRARDLAPVAGAGHRHRRRLPGHRAGAHAGRQCGHAAAEPPGRLRRHHHREPVRRHPHRRGRPDHGLHRDAALGQPRPRDAGPLRAGARLGPGHRRPGHRQPDRHLPVGGDDAALLAGGPRGGRPHRRRGRRRARRGPRTPDLGGDAGTREVGDRLLAALEAA